MSLEIRRCKDDSPKIVRRTYDLVEIIEVELCKNCSKLSKFSRHVSEEEL